MTTVEIINDLLKDKGVSASKMMAELGFSSGLYSQWKSGKQKPSLDKLEKIAEYFSVSVDYLRGASSNVILSSAQQLDTSQLLSIPVLGRVAAGRTCYAEKDITGYEYVSADALREGYDYIYLKVKGDSMEPFLMDGDYVLVQLRDVVDSGSYAVVIIDGEDGLVKKIEYDDTHVSLISVNPYYPPRTFWGAEMNRVKTIGKVVEVKRKI